MVNKQIIINATLEVEGMLRILTARPDDENAYSLLLDKAATLNNLISEAAEIPAAVEEETVENIEEEQQAEATYEPLVFSAEAQTAPALPPFVSEFSINDKYMFIRELFDGSTAEFAEIVNIVDSMQSLGGAYDYFLDELGWDPDNDTVSEFLSIVAKHFNSAQ